LQAIKQLELEDMITLTYNISEADAVIALQSKLKKNSQIQAAVKSQDIPVFFVKVCTCRCYVHCYSLKWQSNSIFTHFSS
jgi:hypothetical protein